MSNDLSRPPEVQRPRFTVLDYVLGVLFVFGANAFVLLVRWVPDWVSVLSAAAAGVALWFWLVVSRKK